ncbi:phage capsid protein [Croceicoccus mobilis]|uniref:Major capsid protein n=1 Tax=Croceicoccus mobilis TaxID=1703339 RepID=A0A917DV31_9SPHN|nr:phage capsid protein [Croceicoccus mobilis]GGD73926.1 hypothetical protein GCM10010990_24430 [Croceicoccus mobilis]
MSFQVPASFQTKYKNNVEMVLQQQRSKLRAAVMEQHDAGAEMVKVKDLVGNSAPQEASERHGDTKYGNTSHDGVWLSKPNELYFAELVDNADKLATSIELTGSYVTAGAGTVRRAWDQRILEGFYDPIVSGSDKQKISTPFPSSNILPATLGGGGSATKLNTNKLRGANKMLTQQYALEDEEIERFMVLTADDNDALLTEVPATSEDFKSSYGGVVYKGKLQTLLGWTFIHLELDNPLLGPISDLATDGSGYRKTPFWVKPGLCMNFWQETNTSIDKVPTKQLSTQVWAGTTASCTRTQAGQSGILLNVKG